MSPDRGDFDDLDPERPSKLEHTELRSRTRPTRRRPALGVPQSTRRRRASLNKWTMIMGVMVGISAVAAALFARANDQPDPLVAVGPPAPASAVSVEVRDIVDGDTLHVETVDGETLTIRVFGIDTPERGEACYSEATDRLRVLAADAVLLLPDERLRDQGGRELRYLFTADGASIDAAMLNEGLAVAWRFDGAFRDELIALEESAQAAGRGCLWGG